MDWTTLAFQAPVIAAFIWFSLEMNKQGSAAQMRFMDVLDKRDIAFEKRNDKICVQLSELTKSIIDHDRYVRENVQRRDPENREWHSDMR